jgi:1-phosphatidylinositol-4-phosphate 5-kinase
MALPDEELSPVDFKAIKRNWIQYSRPNSIHLPLRTVTDFEWKDYCPAVFRFLIVFLVLFVDISQIIMLSFII